MKYRELVMDDMDDAMLSLALRDAFPTTVFCDSGQPLTEPHEEFHATIPECGSTVVSAYMPEPGWRPRFRRDPGNPKWYVYENPPARILNYSRSRWFQGRVETLRWAFDLPTPEVGTISASYDPEDAEQRAFVNTVWRILGRLATNRIRSAVSRDETVLCADVKGGLTWAGHHVLEWCAAAPRRVIAGYARPCDDWAPPETSWYRDLRARAEVLFGAGFGAPASPDDR